jgi:hypothetical protein
MVGDDGPVKERTMGVDEQETVEVVGARTTATVPLFCRQCDAMLAYLVKRADQLADHADHPEAEAELERVVDLIEPYEAARWPSGKVAGGKG